jgi:hypothetical protein
LSNLALKLGLAYEAVKQAFATTKAAPMSVTPGINGLTADSTNFFEVFGTSVFFESYNNSDQVVKAYKECAPLNYILNQKNLQFTNGKLVCEKVFDNGKRSPASKEFNRLLNSPNPLETGKQFLGRLNTIVKLFRYCPVLKIKAAGFESDGVQQLWILPPNKCKIKYYKNKPFPVSIADAIETFELIGDDGKTAIMPKEDIYFFTSKDCTISDILQPSSILESLKYIINNLIKNFESQGVITERRGALGILSPDAGDSAGAQHATPDQKKDLQNDYRKYGLGKDQWQIIISTIAMKFTPMTMNMRELMLLEMHEDGLKTLCMALGFKWQLTPWGGGTAFANQNIGLTAQYQDFTIPEAENIMFQFTDCTEVDLKGVEYSMDYSHVPCLQADEKEKSEVRRNNVTSISLQLTNNLITYGRAMELLGEADSTPLQYSKQFFYELPEEIRATFKQGNAGSDNNSQNQSTNNNGN